MTAKSYAWMEAKTANFNMVKEVYVDAVNGNDSTGDGSISAPYKTMKKIDDNAAAFVTPGTTVYFKAGQTHERRDADIDGINFVNSGTRRQPIVVDRYGLGADPILINLGIDISQSGWTLEANGLYYYEYTGSSVTGLFVDNERLDEADSIANITSGTFYWDQGATDPDNLGNLAGIWWDPATGVPSDFYVSKGAFKDVLSFDGLAYCIIRNIHTKHTTDGIEAWNNGATASSYIVVEDCTGTENRRHVSFANSDAGMADDDGGHHFTYRRNKVLGCIQGLSFVAKTSTQRQFHSSVYENEIIEADYGEKQTNFQANHGFSDHEAMGFQNLVQCRIFDNLIDYRANTLQTTRPWNGIVLWVNPTSYNEGNQWTRNRIFNAHVGGIVLGSSQNDLVTRENFVWNNIIYDCQGFGIKMNVANTTAGSDNFIAHNILHKCQGSVLQTSGGRGVIWKNNLISGGAETLLVDHLDSYTDVVYDYNGYEDAGTGNKFDDSAGADTFANWKTATGQDANSYDTTPTYSGGADPQTAEGFKQTAASDSLGKGTDLTALGIVRDFNGVPFGANRLGAFTTSS